MWLEDMLPSYQQGTAGHRFKSDPPYLGGSSGVEQQFRFSVSHFHIVVFSLYGSRNILPSILPPRVAGSSPAAGSPA